MTANGVRAMLDRNMADVSADGRLSTFPSGRPGEALDQALQAISARYGERTSHVISLQVECSRR